MSRVSSGESAAAPSFGRRDGQLTADRRIKVSRTTFFASISLVTLLTLWGAGAAAYVFFRDDMLAGLFARHSEMQNAYETRIGDLRAQIDRMASRALLDQQQIEQRIEGLMRRQATMETRANVLNGLPDNAKPPVRHTPQAPKADARPEAPIPLSEPGAPIVLDRHSSARPTEGNRLRVSATLAELERSLDRVEAVQKAQLLALEDRYGAKALRMRGVLAEIGFDLRKLPSPNQAGALGGPFVPLPQGAQADAFDRQLQRVHAARERLDTLNQTLVNVPVRKPLNGELETSSGFGVRVDPFFRSPALHSGLDFRASPGEPVRATAAGRVITAGWSGGYGRLVEVDHGNGLTTRYGHLSAILVGEDQTVKPGQIVGRVGSSGRSTGPHLHYETRIDGDPVDPHRFLRAGMRLDDRN